MADENEVLISRPDLQLKVGGDHVLLVALIGQLYILLPRPTELHILILEGNFVLPEEGLGFVSEKLEVHPIRFLEQLDELDECRPSIWDDLTFLILVSEVDPRWR